MKKSNTKIMCWNKGPSIMENSIPEILEIIADHNPQVISILEANHRQGDDMNAIKIDGYNTELDPLFKHGETSRTITYIQDNIKYIRRQDLEDIDTSIIWITIKTPNNKQLNIGTGYRQWRLLGKGKETSTYLAQKERFEKITDKWNIAINEKTETIFMLDANFPGEMILDQQNIPNNPARHQTPLARMVIEKIIEKTNTVLMNKQTTYKQINKQARILDHVYTTNPEMVANVQTIDNGNSDHAIMIMNRLSKKPIFNPRYRSDRQWGIIDTNKVILDINNCQEIQDIQNLEDPTTISETIIDSLNKILDKQSRIKRVQISKRHKTFIKPETKDLIKARNSMYKHAKETDSPTSWILYRQLRNKVTSLIRKDRNEKLLKSVNSETSDSRNIWKQAKNRIGWNKNLAPNILAINGKPITSPKEIAEAINEANLNKIKETTEALQVDEEDPTEYIKKKINNNNNKFSFHKITEEQLKTQLKETKKSNSAGIDTIPMNILLKTSSALIKPITHLINRVIETKKYPENLKISKAIPLLKQQKDPKNPLSYRLIHLLPAISKILERALFSQWILYLENNKLISSVHHGGRMNHSTITAAIDTYDNMLSALESDNPAVLITIDQSLAFDVIPHSKLLLKIEALGADTEATTIFSNYLNNRQQCVEIESFRSQTRRLTKSSVVQGSIGSGYLFLTYILDLESVLEIEQDIEVDDSDANTEDVTDEDNDGVEGEGEDDDVVEEEEVGGDEEIGVKDRGEQDDVNAEIEDDDKYNNIDPARFLEVKLTIPRKKRTPTNKTEPTLATFVDDTSLIIQSKTTQQLNIDTNKILENIENYMKINQLKLNKDKTKIMYLTRHPTTKQQINIKLNNITQELQQTVTLLGFTFSADLKWTEHVLYCEKAIIKNLTTKMHVITTLQRTIPFKSLKMIATSLIQSILIYGIQLWITAPKFAIKKIQVLQHNIARIICGKQMRRSTNEEVMKKMGWFNITQLAEQSITTLTHKIITTQTPITTYNTLRQHITHYTRATTTNTQMAVPIYHAPENTQSNLVQQSFRYRAAKIYANIPQQLKVIDKHTTFKKKIKQIIQQRNNNT